MPALAPTGGEAASPSAPEPSSPKKGLLERSGGRITRRMTVYLPPALAQRLVVHCAATGRPISEVASDALDRYLSRQPAR
jgi:hypothetical protein